MNTGSAAGSPFSGYGGGNTRSSGVDGRKGEVSVVATIPLSSNKKS